MNTEFEIKILDIDVENIKKTLQKLGARYLGKKEYRRYVYDFSASEIGKRIRLRTDGKETTLTHKHIIDGNDISGTKEFEIKVVDFDSTHKFLESLGYQAKAYQENIRESYVLDGCNIEIDSRPNIPTYLEIEGPNKKEVQKMIKKLGLYHHQTTSQNTIQVYHHYGIHDFEEYKYISFKKWSKEIQ